MTQCEMIRLAKVLQHHWELGVHRQQQEVVPFAHVIGTYLKRLRHSEHLLNLARDHGLKLIEPELETKVMYQARCLRITLQDHESSHFPIRRQFFLRDFYQDLEQLNAEFADVRVSWDQTLLIVETESITLEGIELGHFTLRFNWTLWTQEATLGSLQVVAEEPNTAELNSEVTHPHVRDGELCTGDAQSALHKAFAEGRLAEAFLIIRAVLTNYNSKSAYVQLEEWHGVSCYECGHVSNPDERNYCEGCNRDYCQDCISCCNFCDNYRCPSCMEECSCCNDRYCSHCLETSASDQQVCRNCRKICPKCQGIVGSENLDAETGLCADCEVDDPETPSEENVHEAVSIATS